MLKWSKLSLIVAGLISFCTVTVSAQSKPSYGYKGQTEKKESRITYDVSGSTGTYNSRTYNEITLGLNWFFSDWFVWRNAAFSRQSSSSEETYQGLDSSARLTTTLGDPQEGLSLTAFGGPGVRLASKNKNAAFAEAGLSIKLGGIRIGAGAKVLEYFSTQKDSTGVTLPKGDTQYFVTISGGGVL